jgi:uncharacterized protein with PIN domain
MPKSSGIPCPNCGQELTKLYTHTGEGVPQETNKFRCSQCLFGNNRFVWRGGNLHPANSDRAKDYTTCRI